MSALRLPPGVSRESEGAVTLSPSQSITLTVQFAPTVAGAVTGAVTVNSNATGSPNLISLAATGVVPVAHSTSLSWGASTSTVAGYNVYRSTVSGGSYTLLSTSLIGGLTYTDSTVLSGQTYFYVTTAVDGTGTESIYSNEVQAVIP